MQHRAHGLLSIFAKKKYCYPTLLKKAYGRVRTDDLPLTKRVLYR